MTVFLSKIYWKVTKKFFSWFDNDPRNCDHEWHVCATIWSTVSLQVVCPKCLTFGEVPDPSEEEWEAAYGVMERSYYPWNDKTRVVFQLSDDEGVGR